MNSLSALRLASSSLPKQPPLGRRPFRDPDPFQQLAYPSPLAAKHAIADEPL
jgi:hypothetical protein